MDITHHREKTAHTQEIGMLILLTVVSYGTYPLYWFYRNWTHLKEVSGVSIRPALRTLGLLVPFLNIFLIAQQFQQIRELGEKEDTKIYFPSVWVTIGYLALFYLYAGYSAVAIALYSSDTPPSGLEAVGAMSLDLLIFLFAGLLLAVPQRVLNAYWGKAHHDRPVRSCLSAGEIAWISIGGMVWLLSLAQGLLMV